MPFCTCGSRTYELPARRSCCACCARCDMLRCAPHLWWVWRAPPSSCGRQGRGKCHLGRRAAPQGKPAEREHICELAKAGLRCARVGPRSCPCAQLRPPTTRLKTTAFSQSTHCTATPPPHSLTSVVPAWGPASQWRSTRMPNVSTTSTCDSSPAQRLDQHRLIVDAAQEMAHRDSPMDSNCTAAPRRLAGQPWCVCPLPLPANRNLAHPTRPLRLRNRCRLPAARWFECGDHRQATALWESPAQKAMNTAARNTVSARQRKGPSVSPSDACNDATIQTQGAGAPPAV